MLIQLFFIIASSGIALSQPQPIPVIPYDEKQSQFSYKVHKRCQQDTNHHKCMDRSNQKVITSLDINY